MALKVCDRPLAAVGQTGDGSGKYTQGCYGESVIVFISAAGWWTVIEVFVSATDNVA